MTVVAASAEGARRDFASDLARGLGANPKRLACAWCYDRAGSPLFEVICRLPEYYLTRAEAEILGAHAGEIVERTPPGAGLVELGSGSAAKTRVLLAELARRGAPLRYVPIDIAREALEARARWRRRSRLWRCSPSPPSTAPE
jgi:uncharacterized SAM-dependent methyltransferase